VDHGVGKKKSATRILGGGRGEAILKTNTTRRGKKKSRGEKKSSSSESNLYLIRVPTLHSKKGDLKGGDTQKQSKGRRKKSNVRPIERGRG